MAQLLWQRVYGAGAAGVAWRNDAVRGGCVEAAARNVATGRAAAASAGVLPALVAASPEARGALLAARPAALPALAAAAGGASASLCASSLGAPPGRPILSQSSRAALIENP